jgi:hypothetical protein
VAGSILSIQNVIDFYTKPHLVKFKGIKYLQFILWLRGIKNIVRYKKIKIPINYGGDSSVRRRRRDESRPERGLDSS